VSFIGNLVRPGTLIGIATDITERKQAEHNLTVELHALTRLHELATLSIQDGRLEPVLAETLDAAMDLSASDFFARRRARGPRRGDRPRPLAARRGHLEGAGRHARGGDRGCRARIDLSQKQASEAYDLAERHETNPRSVWGYVQGLTRLSQRTSWQDRRFALDRAASRLLATVN